MRQKPYEGKKGKTPFSKKRKRGSIGNNMRKHMGTDVKDPRERVL
jgi:hypothetical protein